MILFNLFNILYAFMTMIYILWILIFGYVTTNS